MKLYKAPRNSRIRLLPTQDNITPPAHRDFVEGEVLTFYHVDGAYSLCRDGAGHAVHLAAWTEVELLDEHI